MPSRTFLALNFASPPLPSACLGLQTKSLKDPTNGARERLGTCDLLVSSRRSSVHGLDGPRRCPGAGSAVRSGALAETL